MKIAIISFTKKGDLMNQRIASVFGQDVVVCFLKEEREKSDKAWSLQEWTGQCFDKEDAIIFVGATGIAVRAIAPFIKRKDVDPAVVVCDELGKFAIPILSGHIGGANELAERIARELGATPVITTATDINHVWAVDNWAAREGYQIVPIEEIKQVSRRMLNGEMVGITSPLFSDVSDIFKQEIPTGLVWKGFGMPAGIVISPYKTPVYEHTLHLIPKCITVGVGSRKEAKKQALCELIDEIIEEHQIFKQAISCIASIDIKKNEKSILQLGEHLKVPVRFYSAEELNQVQGEFSASSFVKSVTGTDNVCERSAIKASLDGQLIVKKTKGNGVTAALAITSNVR